MVAFERLCADKGVPAGPMYRFELALEEVILNAVVHGGEEGEEGISIRPL